METANEIKRTGHLLGDMLIQCTFQNKFCDEVASYRVEERIDQTFGMCHSIAFSNKVRRNGIKYG